MKEHVKNWSEVTCKVVRIDKAGLNGQTTYELEGMPKTYLRHENFKLDEINYLILEFIFFMLIQTV